MYDDYTIGDTDEYSDVSHGAWAFKNFLLFIL